MIYTIIAAVVFFLIVILTLVSVLLFAKAKLLPSGEVTLTINGKENITINPGGTILGTLGDNKIFLPTACGGYPRHKLRAVLVRTRGGCSRKLLDIADAHRDLRGRQKYALVAK